jgi:signal peptidase I
MLSQILTLLSWLALPVGLIVILDDWFVRPQRQILASPQPPRDPGFMRVAYMALPLFIAAAVLRLLMAERLDFSSVLFGITAVTGVVWLIDLVLLRPRRSAAARAAGKDPALIPEPGTVDYARSFFPVALVVLVLRSFIFEPFRIPSDSMMPTLLDGDFILVNKYAYGLRLPVINHKVVPVGSPQRGDVVVFRFPRDPSVNFIKRLVGLPGDHVVVHNDRVTINGQPVPFKILSAYNDGCYLNMQLAEEHLGEHVHQAMLCPTRIERQPVTPAGCNRRESIGYYCHTDGADAAAATEPDPLVEVSMPYDGVVPPGSYFMMGDNRDNSDDSRDWQFVPEDNLVGKATRIWFNWDLKRTGGPQWSRIGSAIK